MRDGSEDRLTASRRMQRAMILAEYPINLSIVSYRQNIDIDERRNYMRENLTTEEAAEFLRYSARQLMRWRAQGIGPPYVRTGNKILYRLQDLIHWLEKKMVEPVREDY